MTVGQAKQIIYFLLTLNLILFSVNAWNIALPSKAWLKSHSTDTRTLASLHLDPHELSKNMTSLKLNCSENISNDVVASHIRLYGNYCLPPTSFNKIEIINKDINLKAVVIQMDASLSSDYLYVGNGKNKIEINYIDNNDQIVLSQNLELNRKEPIQ